MWLKLRWTKVIPVAEDDLSALLIYQMSFSLFIFAFFIKALCKFQVSKHFIDLKSKSYDFMFKLAYGKCLNLHIDLNFAHSFKEEETFYHIRKLLKLH